VRRLAPAVPQVAAAAPLVPFAFVGTTVPIEPWAMDVLIVTALFVVLGTIAAVISGTRFARVVAGGLLTVWWGFLAIALIPTVGDGQVSWFGITTFIAIPVLVASTYGLSWGIHDVEERVK
jgi:hypothetical protein